MTELSRFEPATRGATGLFLDTSGLYPYFYDRAAQHEEVTAFFDALAENEIPYRPLFTNQYVADELVSLLVNHAGYAAAAGALRALLESNTLTVLDVDPETFDDAVATFFQYDEQPISLTDHTIGRQAEANGVEYVLAYDGDFETLGLTVVPRDE